MESYFNIPLELWEKYAHEACLATDQKVKGQAQQFFYHFVQTPPLDLFISLIEAGSDLLLFVLFSYIYKSPHPFIKNRQNFYILMRVVERWQMHELSFSRSNTQLCQNYVTKTIMAALGVFMKILYENEQTMNGLINYIESLPLTYFKIYLLKSFVEAVQTIDTEIGYIRFRAMMSNFQDNVMPMICQSLVPFFQKFEEGVRISQLSLLQQKLTVNDNSGSYQSNQVLLNLSKEQDVQSQLVLMLLKKIVQFNYNITYTQYESQQAIQACLITFPEKVLHKIINHQFLTSLFYVIEKVCETKIGEKKKEYLSIVLECLAKIMQSRLAYLPQENKFLFIRTAVRGLSNLMNVCQQLQNQTLLEGVLICNKKLYMSAQVLYIQKVIDKDEQLRQEGLFRLYIRNLYWMITQIIKKSVIKVDNSLLNQALEVACKLVTSIGCKDTENIQHQDNCAFIKEIISSFIGSLCQPHQIFIFQKTIWIAQNKLAVANLIQNFKKISSYSYEYLFFVLGNYLEKLSTQKTIDLAVFANILFLLSELVDHNYLDRTINFNQATNEEILLLGNIVIKGTQLAQRYMNNRATFSSNKHSHYLDIAILIFSEAILLDFLSNFQSVNSIKIRQKLYLIMTKGISSVKAQDDYTKEDTNSQFTIMGYLELIYPFLTAKIVTEDADVKMFYVLQIIEKIVFKLKWNMRRQMFLKCNIFKYLLSFFDNYFSRCYPSPQIIAKVGKLTVVLNFDDVLDEYKFKINKVIQKLPQDQPFQIFYYLTGIFEAIQSGNICRYFCYRLRQVIDLKNFFTQLLKDTFTANTDKIYKDFMRFFKLIILNKGLKHNNNSTLTYQLFNLMLPHLQFFMSTINSIEIDFNLFGDGILELIDLFCGVINGTHVNIFFLAQSSQKIRMGQEIQSSLGVQFVLQFLTLIVNLCKQLKMYPKLQESILFCFISINKQILPFIYDTQDRRPSEIYKNVIQVQLQLTSDYVCQVFSGKNLTQDKLLKVIDSLRLFFQFFNSQYPMWHKRVMIGHLRRFRFFLEHEIAEKSLKFVNHVLSLILTHNKNNLSYVRSISKLIFELSKHFQPNILENLDKIYQNGCRFDVEAIRKILENGTREQEEVFVEKFKGWVKQVSQQK